MALPTFLGTARPSVARSVMDDLVQPATMSAVRPSARGNALTASEYAGTTTADGCIRLRLPKDSNEL